jgi:predicted transcriptional regulator
MTTILKIRLPQALRAELEQLAKATGRSKSDYARQAIIEFLERTKRDSGRHD